MSVSAVASVAVPIASFALSRPVAGEVAGTSSTAASPAVINNVKPAGNGQAVTASDIQNQVDGTNRLIEGFGHTDWAKLAKQYGGSVAYYGQQQLLTNLQLGESATIASAGKAGVSGINLTFDKPDASVLLPNPRATSDQSASIDRTYLPSGLINQAASTATGNSSTFRLNASTPFQSGGASVALALLEASSSSNAATSPDAHPAPKHNFYV